MYTLFEGRAGVRRAVLASKNETTTASSAGCMRWLDPTIFSHSRGFHCISPRRGGPCLFVLVSWSVDKGEAPLARATGGKPSPRHIQYKLPPLLVSSLVHSSPLVALPLARVPRSRINMTDKSVWDKEVPVPLHVIRYIDAGVRESKAHGSPSPTTLLLDDLVTIQAAGICSHHCT